MTREAPAGGPLADAAGVPGETMFLRKAAPVIDQEPSPGYRSHPAGPPADPAEFADALRHLAWRRAPCATLGVDASASRLLVTCYSGLPHVEVDYGETLSAGFHRVADEYLLTSLCLDDVFDWSPDRPDVETARELLGEDLVRATENLLVRGGRAGVVLDQANADHLVDVWRAYVDDHAPTAGG